MRVQEKSSIAVLEKASKGKGDGWADSGANGAKSKAEAERIMFKGVTDDDRKGLQDALNREKVCACMCMPVMHHYDRSCARIREWWRHASRAGQLAAGDALAVSGGLGE